MKRSKVALLIFACVALLAVSWFSTITAKSDVDRQRELIGQAQFFLDDEIYVKAEPLLVEAAGYDTKLRQDAESKLKQVYLHLIEQKGYAKKYTRLLESEMERRKPNPDDFIEAFQYYSEIGKYTEAISALRRGASALKDDEMLSEMYEKNRYAFKDGSAGYHDVKAIYEGTVAVMNDGLWGVALANGDLLIQCEYDDIGVYSGGQAIARISNRVEGVNSEGIRTALYHGNPTDFTNFACGRLGIKEREGWVLVDESLRKIGETSYQEFGMFNEDRAPAKQDGYWGLLGTDGKWEIEPTYEEIVCDPDLGYAYAHGRYFAKENGSIYLFDKKGKRVSDEKYEDAKPFSGNYAAVKKNGLWGFIDVDGNLIIDYTFDDARSFGQHLAAVKIGRNWGYASLAGKLVIEPRFLDAKSFYNGSAPVLTVDGWHFITLYEYE